jgi:hypothetical protein
MDGFELTLDRFDVVIEDDSRGTRYELRHTFRPPTDAEWQDYKRAELLTFRTAPMQAEIQLWEAAIEAVDDRYLWQGEPVTRQADWKRKIPTHHKYMAARALLSVRQKLVDGPLA